MPSVVWPAVSVVGIGTVLLAAVADAQPAPLGIAAGLAAGAAVVVAGLVVPARGGEPDPRLLPIRRRLYLFGFSGGAIAFTALLASAAAGGPVGAGSWHASRMPELSSMALLLLPAAALLPASLRRQIRLALVMASLLFPVDWWDAPPWVALLLVPLCAVGWESLPAKASSGARVSALVVVAAVTAIAVVRPWPTPFANAEGLVLASGACVLLLAVSAAGNAYAIAAWSGTNVIAVTGGIGLLGLATVLIGMPAAWWFAMPASATVLLVAARVRDRLHQGPVPRASMSAT